MGGDSRGHWADVSCARPRDCYVNKVFLERPDSTEVAMAVVHIDNYCSDEERRERIFAGDIFIYSPTKAAQELISHARQMIEEGFAPRDPEKAQYDMDVTDYAALLGRLKPAFIHHPRSKQLVAQIITSLGGNPNKTYFDVPKMRSSTSDAYLTTGIALAFPPHRDTWYSAPFFQINWWTPIYEITIDNGMAFYPRHFEEPIANNSEVYNYYRWNMTRAQAHLDLSGGGARVAPEAQAPVGDSPDARYVVPPGGLILFSAAQLHASLPNHSGRTRFSIDFRTIHFDEVLSGNGAKNIDSACTGTALRDFMRCTDHALLPEELVKPYDSGDQSDGILQYNATISV